MSLALVLQTYGTSTGKGDIRASVDLTSLIADIEPNFRSDCYFMVVFRKDTPRDLVNRCVQNLSDKFKVDAFVARSYGTGHPYGSNLLWQSAMTEVTALAKDHKKFPHNGVLTFESDCVPLRRDWISALTREWNEKVIQAGEWTEDDEDPGRHRFIGQPKFEVMGHKDRDHINGNMVLRTDFLSRHQVPYTTDCGWDFYPPNRDMFLRVGYDTNMILQNYRRATIVRQEIPFLLKNGEVPALFHGAQGDVGTRMRRFMREILVEGVPV